MFEVDADGLDQVFQMEQLVFATLVYQHRSHTFHAARKSLRRLGASYDHELRAWRLTVNEDTIDPLRRLYARSSMALWVIEDGDEVSAESFERYQP